MVSFIFYSNNLLYIYVLIPCIVFLVDADTKKSVLKTLAAMDLDKINMDLVESVLEWIVDGKHNYPPGKNRPHIVNSAMSRLIPDTWGFLLWGWCDLVVSLPRRSAGVFTRAG